MGSSRTAQGASPGFKVQIAESPERAAQGVRFQLQITARHKEPLWYRDQLHRPCGASFAPETSLVSGAKPRTPKGSSRTAQGASPGFKVQIAESPERAAQGVRSQLQINARHKAHLWYRDPLHRPFGASVVTVLVPRARALGFPESPLRG